MIKVNQKFDENKLAEFIYDDIVRCLKDIGKSIDNEFKYDRVVLIDALVDNFSFDTSFKILSEKREGNYSYQKSNLGYHLRCNFKKV